MMESSRVRLRTSSSTKKVCATGAGSATVGKPWQQNETRESKFVLIGRDLDEAELRAGFESCRAL